MASLGFIGVGRLGGAMVRRLVERGHQVRIFDLDEAAMAPLAELGAMPARSARAIADAEEVVFACLPTTAACRAAALGPDGVSGGERIRCYVECSTIGREAMAAIASELRPLPLVDAPVSGAVDGALAGTLATAISGDPAALAAALPIIRDYASNVFEVGEEPGLSQVYKLANQGIAFSLVPLCAEAIVSAVKAGAEPKTLVDFLNVSLCRNWATAALFPNTILPGRIGDGTLSIVGKDLTLYAEMCHAAGVPRLMTSQVTSAMEAMSARPEVANELAGFCQLFEHWAGVEVRDRDEGVKSELRGDLS